MNHIILLSAILCFSGCQADSGFSATDGVDKTATQQKRYSGSGNNESRTMAANKARNPQIAIQEEFDRASEKNTVEAWELFIARHPDNPLTERARASLARLR